MAERAPYHDRALVLLRTMQVKQAHLALVGEGYDLKANALHAFKTRHKAEILKAAEPLRPARFSAGELMPWDVLGQHNSNYHALKLRQFARRLHGVKLADNEIMHQHEAGKLDAWIKSLTYADQVVNYDQEQGFHLVKRRWFEPAPGVSAPLDHWIKNPHRNDDGTYRDVN